MTDRTVFDSMPDDEKWHLLAGERETVRRQSALLDRLATDRRTENAAEITGSWGKLKVTGGAMLVVGAIVIHAYFSYAEHKGIESKYDSLVREAQTTNYLQSLPPDKRPPLPMPPHLRDLLMRAHGTVPTVAGP